jgi:hypothetical protein
MNKGSEDKIGVLDLRRAELLRTLGLKITPALREYCRYTGISAEVEKHLLPHCPDGQLPAPPEAPKHHTHRH